ncbi:MAG: hypothetical protein RBG13Loki_1574 [Promethearchaeota archaeon CR_4]|nr:MAG: hypothetical protein RBG13Loki_1574 [Candidatus Lokiarchaeota archaeon CR_4]
MISITPPFRPDQPYDVILVSGDYWADHPHSGVGVIARILEAYGYSVGIIEKPDWRFTKDFLRLGLPRLFFGITAGAIDSMLNNYTPLKKLRSEDPHASHASGIPDRAIIIYSQKIREAQKRVLQQSGSDIKEARPIIIGGVEASLRRFTHYDYWDNAVRRPILFDAKADLLVYGPGEHQVVEIAKRLENNQQLLGIKGTCIIANKIPVESEDGLFEMLPSHEEAQSDKTTFCRMQLQFSNEKNLAQPLKNRYLLQFRMNRYSSRDLDSLYNLPFSYKIPESFKEFAMAKFSIMTHRGCFGNCHFCTIALHQGSRVISRSADNILAEIRKMVTLPDFKGYISDLGGPSANMYGMDCDNACGKDCMACPSLDRSHLQALALLRASRQIPGIKKTFVRSGIRFDLALHADEYLKELINHHVSGTLKIAPEHFSHRVLALMNKDTDCFDAFTTKFGEINKNPGQSLRYYFITGHPGSTLEEVEILRKKMESLQNVEKVQLFTPTPMSVSTCMYYTGLNPFTLEPVYVPYTYHEKKMQKKVLFSKPKK